MTSIPPHSGEPFTYDLSLLEGSMAKWRASPALREGYGDIFIELGRHLGDGSTIELGSGIGVIKEFFPGVVTSGVVKSKFLDLAVSTYDIPLKAQSSWQDIVAFDRL